MHRWWSLPIHIWEVEQQRFFLNLSLVDINKNMFTLLLRWQPFLNVFEHLYYFPCYRKFAKLCVCGGNVNVMIRSAYRLWYGENFLMVNGREARWSKIDSGSFTSACAVCMPRTKCMLYRSRSARQPFWFRTPTFVGSHLCSCCPRILESLRCKWVY